MFHVHSDKRSQRSARKIADTVNELLTSESFSDMTIADVQRKTGIARTTFYRSFDNLIDVLEWQCDQRFQNLFARWSGLKRFPNEGVVLRQFLDFWAKDPQILISLIQIQRIDIIYRFLKKYAELLAEEYGPLTGLTSQDKKYFLSVRVGFVLSIILTWLRGGQVESIDELQSIARRQVDYLKRSFDE